MSAEVRKRARHPAGSFLVQAPAGSGKTELLTQRILALLAIVDEPEEILALTFTRKAAAEMRKRVLDSFTAVRPDPSETHKMETWQLAQKARARSDERGWHLAAHPSRLRMMTLDSFTFSLARQLPLLSGMGEMPTPSEFAELLYRDAAENALNQAMRDFPDAAEQILLHQDHNAVAVVTLLADMLARREQWLGTVASHARDLAGCRQQLEHDLATVMQQKLAMCDVLIPAVIKAELPELMRFAAQQIGDDALALASWPAHDLDQLAAWQSIANMLLISGKANFRKAGSVTARSGFPAGKAFAEPKARMKQVFELMAGCHELAEALHALRLLPASPNMDDQQWQVVESLFLVLVLANQQLQQLFALRGEADFTEIALRAMDALGANDAAPGELLMKLDYRIHHILVDEFQDTSYLQMRLLQTLTAGWQQSDGRHRSLFMVGDPMQSIYRFRKAEVGLFLNAANNQAGLPEVEAVQLERNFRSAPAIVDWVNMAFRHIFPGCQDVVSGAVSYAPATASLTHEGAVNLYLQQGADPALEADCVVSLIQKELNEHEAGQCSASRRIGVLARSRKHLHAIMQALSDAGIAFRAINILPLNSRPEIRLLRALLRALLHPADRESWAALLRAPCCGLDAVDLHALLAGDGHGSERAGQALLVPQLLTDEAVLQRLSESGRRRVRFLQCALAPSLAVSGRVGLRHLLESAWYRLSMPDLIDATAVRNVDAALSLIETLEEGGRIDFGLLDARLQGLFAAPDMSERAVQVELLTMHGAKGLQWDVVILPGLGYGGVRSDTPLLAFTEVPTAAGAMPLMAVKAATRSKDALYSLINSVEKSKYDNELQRLLYVACTRAQSKLHLFGHVSEKRSEPANGSLLRLLIGDDEGCYGAQIHHIATGEQDGLHRPAAIKRIKHPPDPPANPVSVSEEEEIEYVWAGAEAAPVGNAVHALLEQIGMRGIDSWQAMDPADQYARITRLLEMEGISGSMLAAAAKRCHFALHQTQNSSRGCWILSGENRVDVHCEWQLSSCHHGVVTHHVIDRSFIDADDVRWIIDYKTAAHEGGDRDLFLDVELQRHASQLRRYIALLELREPEREIRAALYFPMLDGWRELV